MHKLSAVRVYQPSPPELRIVWTDGHESRHTTRTLRRYCPCAACKEERVTDEGSTLLPVITPRQYELQSVEPVGAYALQIGWADGHRTGIYTYEYLREICECTECLKRAQE